MELLKIVVPLSFGLVFEALEIIFIGFSIVIPSFMIGVIVGYILYEYTSIFGWR